MGTLLLLAMITVSEATIGVFVKLVDGRVPIQTLNFYALAVAAGFLALALPRATGQPLRVPWDDVRDTVVIGALIAAQISVFNYAMTLVPIANAVVFWSVAPLFVFLFSWLFLNEPAKPTYIVIFALALVGVALARPLEGGHTFGNLVALGDGALYAAMVTYMRFEGTSDTGNDIAWSMIVAAVLLSPAPLLAGAGDVGGWITYEALGISVPVMAWAMALGVVSTGCAYLGISIVLRRVTANVYSLVDVVVSPLVAALLGFLIFGEVPAASMIGGGALLLAAGFWLTREMARPDPRRAAHPAQGSRRRTER